MTPEKSVKDIWNMACPRCGADNEIDIAAIVQARLCCDGTDASSAASRDHEWNARSAARCNSCGHRGTVADFSAEQPCAATPTKHLPPDPEPINADISPIDAAKALTPNWMRNIHDFDALEIHPCAIIATASDGSEIVEPCEPNEAAFWTVYGHYRTGGVEAFEDLPTEAKATAFRDKLLAAYPHLDT